MNIQSNVLNRLIAARHLIDCSGPELTSISAPLAVAQKVLLVHDVAELALLALLPGGKGSRDQSFMDLADAVLGKAYQGDIAEVAPRLGLLRHMNQVRVAFKHQGLLPDTASSYHLFSNIVDILNNVCELLLGTPLLDVDHTAAIHSGEVRNRFADARIHMGRGEYQQALECIAFGLVTAFWFSPMPSFIVPGVPSSEDALLLSGRGIDPASFLNMQKLLPSAYPGDSEATWQLRKTGHPGNWTLESAEFCLRTAISTVVSLQSAPGMPTPVEFYSQFEDVIEVIAVNPVAYFCTAYLMDDPEFTKFDRFHQYDRISGKAVGHIQMKPDSPECDPERAEFIELLNPAHELLEVKENRMFHSEALWFKRADVKITYQTNLLFEESQKARTDYLAKSEE